MEFKSAFKGLMNLEFSRQIFKKYSNIQFNENPSGGSGAVPSGRKDGQK
jgi:hypothetical protein